MSFKAEVIADTTGKWVGNDLVFRTREEALAYAKDLFSRWTVVQSTRVVFTDDEPTYTFRNGYASRVGTL